MPAPTVTMPEALKAKTLYEQGLALDEIGERLNLNRNKIKRAFRWIGVQMRSRSEAQRLRYERASA